MFRFWRDRRAWEAAKRTHVFEHATLQPLSILCDDIGHWGVTDHYSEFFDHDQRRKFCMATGRKWKARA